MSARPEQRAVLETRGGVRGYRLEAEGTVRPLLTVVVTPLQRSVENPRRTWRGRSESTRHCCCIWWLGGGAVAAYLLQANTSRPIPADDGALIGLMTGLVGAFVWAIVSIPIDLIRGPVQRAMFQRMLSTTADMPGSAREILQNMQASTGLIVSIVVGFVFMLFMGTIFTTLGGLLGAVMFQKPQRAPVIDVTPSDRPM